ncbi:AAEL003903-PA [Aedes aegypti]|uniref:acid phosphatase n=1 Tax=Aedes aegypti TaxID=7159 RepID=Q17E64_AEDAE|nr:AAEL003903-PA [Aedes aegypti]
MHPPCSRTSGPYGVLMLVLIVASMSVSNVRSQQEANEDEGQLLFAHVIYRHGDRTPIEAYPTDPWKDPSHWSTGWGQLTNAGKMRHLMLGNWLRERYSTLLSKTYTNNEIYVRSTDVDRTLMSAESNLAGLFPPTGKDQWDPAIQWQPIPVHTVPETLDEILAAKKSCPAFDYALKKYKQSDEFQTYNKSLEPVYEYVTAHSGRRIDSLTSAQNLYSCLHIEDLNNFTLPEWTKQVYPEPLRSISSKSFTTKTNTPMLARLKTGPLIKEMLQRFRSKVDNTLKPNRTLWVYSAHDTTVANVLNTLRLFDLHNPPFAACILLELRRSVSGGEPYVSVYYKNTTKEPEPMSIPNCGTRCPLSQMFKVYSEILPDNWKRECEVSILSLTYVEADMSSPTSAIGIVFLAMVGVLVIALAMGAYIRRRRGYYKDKWYLRIDG